ncbi:MAG: hydrogen gas-evolving membrane-bound hydrogenase subunit E [Bacillota bacterium]
MKKLGPILILLMGFMFLYSAVDLPKVGDPNTPASEHVSPRYIEKSKKETASPNMVTAVLADYRGIDTLGETSVIFVAGVATFMILRGYRKDEGGDN